MNHLNLLKQEPAYEKLFRLFKAKYESLGRVGGSVSLKRFTSRELEAISGLTGISFEELAEKQSLTLLRFEKELGKTQFEAYSLPALLEAFFAEPLLIKKDRLAAERNLEEDFLSIAMEQYPQLTWYITWLSGKSPDTRWIWGLYKEDSVKLLSQLSMLERAFHQLTKETVLLRLPLFAQQITGNPHGLDRHEQMGKLLLHALTVDQLLKGSDLSFQRSAEEENDLLGLYGLLRDDLWSFVTFQNLIGEMKDQGIHPVWQAASDMGSVLNLPLKEILKVSHARARVGNHVYVIENSSVASTIMDLHPAAPIICTHGQLRLASWRLLDLLYDSGMTIYYSGDLDPEGLLIADRIKNKYKSKAVLWRMDKQTYHTYQSEEVISESSLVKVNHLSSEQLKEVALQMKMIKKAAFQEAYVEKLVKDLESSL